MYTWKMRMTSSSSITQMMNSLSLSKCQSLQQKKKRCKQQQPILRTTLTQTAWSTITPGFNPFTIRLTIYTNSPKKELFKVVSLKKPAFHFGVDIKHLEKGTFGKQWCHYSLDALVILVSCRPRFFCPRDRGDGQWKRVARWTKNSGMSMSENVVKRFDGRWLVTWTGKISFVSNTDGKLNTSLKSERLNFWSSI